MIGEEGEILDIVLRSALRAEHGVGEREVRLARRYTLHVRLWSRIDRMSTC